MKLIGGDLQVQSEDGVGTTIWAFAPVASKHDSGDADRTHELVESQMADLAW
jgi:hypothetical protein